MHLLEMKVLKLSIQYYANITYTYAEKVKTRAGGRVDADAAGAGPRADVHDEEGVVAAHKAWLGRVASWQRGGAARSRAWLPSMAMHGQRQGTGPPPTWRVAMEEGGLQHGGRVRNMGREGRACKN
jgi:hypothetical protein